MKAHVKKIIATAVICTAITSNLFANVNPVRYDTVCMPVVISADAEGINGRYMDQKKLKDYQLSGAGCLLVSFANCLAYGNGYKISEKELKEIGLNSKGWSYEEGGVRNTFAKYIKNNDTLHSKYSFEVVSYKSGNVTSEELKKHLSSSRGNVAICHVFFHFITVVDYNRSTDEYLVIDGYLDNARSLPAYGWVKADKLNSNNKNSKIDWFCLIKCKDMEPETGTVTTNTHGGSGGRLVTYLPKYSGKSTSLVDALKACKCDSSFEYRRKLYNYNGFTSKYGSYSGKASQNRAILAALKAGKLMKA